MTACDWSERQREIRVGEANALRPVVPAAPPRQHCLGCGKPVEMSWHYGRQWIFDAQSDDLHKCTYRRPRRW